MAGYSGKSLAYKLGIKEGFRVIVIDPPENYFKNLGEINFPVQFNNKLNGVFNLIHYFANSKSKLQKIFPRLIKHLKPKGMIWISWPKKSSGIKSEITEDSLREVGLPLGVVDIKVIAVDETWSGLKFVTQETAWGIEHRA